MSEYQSSTTIFLEPEEFSQDERRLGKANGNTYQRKPGIPNVHDGQIMVRLKKKRFIILDYGYIPNQRDAEIAQVVPHISIPNGAGTCKCATKDCPRIGVPVLMYDSEPDEPMSLYLRGGLCFSCQRSLNEKRRTQRKRKSNRQPVVEVRMGAGDGPTIGSGSGNNGCQFKFNDQIVELNPDAVVINGPVVGTRVRGPDYRCPEIGSDLLRIVSELSHETLSLMHLSSGGRPGMSPPVATTSSVDTMYQQAFLSCSKATFLLTQWKASYDERMAADAAEAAAAEACAATASATFDSQVLEQAVSSSQATSGRGANFPSSSEMGFSVNAHDLPLQPLSNNESHAGDSEQRLEV